MDNRHHAVIDIETTGVNPKNGCIICIGVKDIKNGDTVHVFHDEDEEQMLKEFLNYQSKRGFDTFVAWNDDFDFRYIWARCLKYKLPMQGFSTLYRIDLQDLAEGAKHGYTRNTRGDGEWEAMDDWAEFLLGEQKVLDSSNIPELYEKGEIDRILKHCRKDVNLEAQIWQIINKLTEKSY